MIFKLLESIPTINPSLEKQWNNSNDKQKREILNTLIDSDYKKPSLHNIEEAMFSIFKSFGLHNNPFIEFFDKADKISKKDYEDQIVRLKDLYLAGFTNLKDDYLFNPTLYAGRKDNEFDYTVKILDSTTNKNKLKKYYNDITNIDIKDLYDGNSIKPAGGPQTKDDFSTIYGVVQHWTNEDRSKYGEDDKEYSLYDWFRKIKVGYKERSNAVRLLIDRYYEKAVERESLIGRTSKESYINTANLLLNSDSGLKRIPPYEDKYYNRFPRFSTPQDIPSKYYKLGTVVIVNSNKPHLSSGPNIESTGADFVVYDGNKWVTTDEYNKQISERNSGIEKLADKFVNNKYISDISDNINVTKDVCLWLQGNASDDDIKKAQSGDYDDYSYRI